MPEDFSIIVSELGDAAPSPLLAYRSCDDLQQLILLDKLLFYSFSEFYYKENIFEFLNEWLGEFKFEMMLVLTFL